MTELVLYEDYCEKCNKFTYFSTINFREYQTLICLVCKTFFELNWDETLTEIKPPILIPEKNLTLDNFCKNEVNKKCTKT